MNTRNKPKPKVQLNSDSRGKLETTTSERRFPITGLLNEKVYFKKVNKVELSTLVKREKTFNSGAKHKLNLRKIKGKVRSEVPFLRYLPKYLHKFSETKTESVTKLSGIKKEMVKY